MQMYYIVQIRINQILNIQHQYYNNAFMDYRKVKKVIIKKAKWYKTKSIIISHKTINNRQYKNNYQSHHTL